MSFRPIIWIVTTLLASVAAATFFGQSPPAPLIEVNHTYSVIGGQHSSLFVRLAQDGKVEWETWEFGKPNEMHSKIVSPEVVAGILHRLGEIDVSGIQRKMGPYNVYVDTGHELLIRIRVATWSREFSVSNPWPGHQIKPLPKDLKNILCEVSRLRSQVSGEPTQFCKG